MAEMTALEFLKCKDRICRTYRSVYSKPTKYTCNDCPIWRSRPDQSEGCGIFLRKYPERAIAIVQKWALEHPRKTILQDLLEKYPNVELEYNKFPEICPHSLGYATNEKCFLDTDERFFSEECEECWNRPLEEVENND